METEPVSTQITLVVSIENWPVFKWIKVSLLAPVKFVAEKAMKTYHGEWTVRNRKGYILNPQKSCNNNGLGDGDLIYLSKKK